MMLFLQRLKLALTIIVYHDVDVVVVRRDKKGRFIK